MLGPNNSEAKWLSGYDNNDKCTRAMLRMGPKRGFIRRLKYELTSVSWPAMDGAQSALYRVN